MRSQAEESVSTYRNFYLVDENVLSKKARAEEMSKKKANCVTQKGYFPQIQLQVLTKKHKYMTTKTSILVIS